MSFNLRQSISCRLLLARSWYEYFQDLTRFRQLLKKESLSSDIRLSSIYPIVKDKTITHGFPRIYVYHTAWAARVLAKTRPKKHIDISSSIWFSTLVSAFLPFEFYDYRATNIELSNLRVGHADLTKLPFRTNSITSLSCMHTIEHIGLGRYGDPLDPSGDIKAIQELKRVTKIGGDLLIVVPVGEPKVMFNAHRIYAYKQILNYFEGFQLKEFALIKEHDGGLMVHADPRKIEKQTTLNGDCGCFWFRKCKS